MYIREVTLTIHSYFSTAILKQYRKSVIYFTAEKKCDLSSLYLAKVSTEGYTNCTALSSFIGAQLKQSENILFFMYFPTEKFHKH